MPTEEWPPTDHQPALSHTNAEIYNTCRRKWFLQYQWRYVPTEISYDISLQRVMVPANMLAGCIVDTVITMAIRRYKSGLPWRDDLHGDARKAMTYYKEYSLLFKSFADRRKNWPKPEKHWVRPIDMIVYEGAVSDTHAAVTWNTVDTCLTNFRNFMKNEELYDADPSEWRLAEGMPGPWFWCGDVPVYANYDFALNDGDGLRIIDWKAGKSERGESTARSQLQWYGAYAIGEWNADPTKLTLHAVWLQDNNRVTVAKFGQEQFDLLKGTMAQVYKEQGSTVTTLKANPDAYAEIFPMTDDLQQCFWCSYRSCAGRTRLAGMMHDEVIQIEDSGSP